MKVLPARRRGLPPGDEAWPWGLYIKGWSVLPLLAAIAILWQRHALTSPGRATLFAGMAVLPWVLQSLRIDVPTLLFGALVFGGTLGLVLRPVDIDIAPFMLVFLVAETSAVCPPSTSVPWALAAMGLMGGAEIWGPYDESLPWYFGIALGWVGGYMVQAQLSLLTELRAAQAHLAEQAATDERRRLARELHDVIAHSLTVMMLHVTGARRALDRDPHDAAEALEEAERLGRQSLQDVRRVVGVLGERNDRENAPLPQGSDIAALINQVRSAGASIAVTIDGPLGSLEPATGLALYRMVQESLTNAAKHAAGNRVEIALRVDHDAASLRVANELHENAAPPQRSRGLGLLGMRERAALLGGSFSAGARDGRWVIEATLPRAPAM